MLSSLRNTLIIKEYGFEAFSSRPLDHLTLSFPDQVMESTFESVEETLQCDHSKETSLVVLSISTICILAFHKIKFGIFG